MTETYQIACILNYVHENNKQTLNSVGSVRAAAKRFIL